MRPKKYPYSKQRYQEVIVNETRFPYSNMVSRIIAVKDTYTGKIIDYRFEESKS